MYVCDPTHPPTHRLTQVCVCVCVPLIAIRSIDNWPPTRKPSTPPPASSIEVPKTEHQQIWQKQQNHRKLVSRSVRERGGKGSGRTEGRRQDLCVCEVGEVRGAIDQIHDDSHGTHNTLEEQRGHWPRRAMKNIQSRTVSHPVSQSKPKPNPIR